ncbi:MAG: alcohol dehydrogenase catalytic domain-containing protein [Pseudomonadota bacterium]
MKAALCRDFGKPLTIEEVALDGPGLGQVQVKMAACAICHSDIAYADGYWGGALPMVLGHEAAGIVMEVGPGVRGFAKGDRVLVTLIRACGSCSACRTGAPTSCEHAWVRDATPLHSKDGPIAQGMSTAAFAEAVTVDQSQVVALPSGIDMAAASLLSCGVLTGVGAVTNTARLRTGETCAVGPTAAA